MEKGPLRAKSNFSLCATIRSCVGHKTGQLFLLRNE